MTEKTEETSPYGFDDPDDEETCEDCGHVGPRDGFHGCGDEPAVSDGTMPCPVPHPDGADAPCTKKIPKGWTAEEGHAGGHFWMSREIAAALDRGDHYDAHAALSGQPFSFHLPSECPGFPECNDWRAKPRPNAFDSGSSVRSVDVVETRPCSGCGAPCQRRPGGWSCTHWAGCNASWKRDGW